MSGRPGQLHHKRKVGAARSRIWQSIRILRRFTLPDLVRTAGVKLDNAKKFVQALTRHGYLVNSSASDYVSGARGVYKHWSIRINPGPDYPLVCARCGRSVMRAKECRPAEVSHDGK